GEERDDDAYLREIFARFLPRAYRRPATDDEINRIVAWTRDERLKRELPFPQAVREGVKNVLCSPAFLYLGGESESNAVHIAAVSEIGASNVAAVDTTTSAASPRPIDSWQLANRLAYLLWSAPPDDALAAVARSGRLEDAKTLREQ